MANRRIRLVELPEEIQASNLRQFDPAYWFRTPSNGNAILGIGSIKKINAPSFEALHELVSEGDWAMGFIAYDAKNQLENLSSKNPSIHHLKDLEFHIPELVIRWKENRVEVHYHEAHTDDARIDEVLLMLSKPVEVSTGSQVKFQSRISKDEYLDTIRALQQEIQYGNIYETNFCQEFFAHAAIDPYVVYDDLFQISPTPFSCFLRSDSFYLMCASPERYLKKEGEMLISEPIKGTIKRNSDPALDDALKKCLLNSEKDRRENVMIVDLVRNDLSRVAQKKSVCVEELFGIYSFPQVHQMISRISARLAEEHSAVDAIKATFPMGSMTGAPKIKAMEIIEEHESFKRGIYSGTVGYFTPEGDFDFNVVIRSLMYSQEKEMLSFAVGGAITSLSDPEDEYNESLLKAKAIFQLFE